MSDQDRCLRAAEECERLARRTVVITDRMSLLNMAKLWRELAQGWPSVEGGATPASPDARPNRRN